MAYGSRMLSGLNRATGTHTRSCALGVVNLGRSSIWRTSSPDQDPITVQSKHWIIAASTPGSIFMVKFTPGHTLLPDPKGRSWKCCPLTSTEFTWLSVPSCRNLSGQKSNGQSQIFGSLPTAQTFTNNMVFVGMSYPPILHCCTDFLVTRDTGGCSLNVSFTMAWRYGRFSTSGSPTSRLFPMTRSISSLAFSSTLGWLMSSANAHSSEIAFVSVPAVNKSWRINVLKGTSILKANMKTHMCNLTSNVC